MEAKRIYRSREPKVLGGVCAGLAKYFNLDVVLVRLIFVLGMFFTCIFPFFIIYLVLWLAVPIEPINQPKDTTIPSTDQPKTE